MLIAFAFSFIGILLIYGNYKILRYNKILFAFFLVAILLSALGGYLYLNVDLQNPFIIMPLFSPLIALILLQLARIWFKFIRKQEIILYLGGFLPKRFEERFVSRFEKAVTFLITAGALLLSYYMVSILHSIEKVL